MFWFLTDSEIYKLITATKLFLSTREVKTIDRGHRSDDMSFNPKSVWLLATDLDLLFNADASPSRFKGAFVYNARKFGHIASRDWSLTAGPFYISTAWRCLRWDGRVLTNTSVIIEYKRKVCPLHSPLRVNLNPLYIELCQSRSEISIMSKRRIVKDKLSSGRQDSSKKSPRVVKSKKFIRPRGW